MWDQQENNLLRLPVLVSPESITNNKSFYLLLKLPAPLPAITLDKQSDPILIGNFEFYSYLCND